MELYIAIFLKGLKWFVYLKEIIGFFMMLDCFLK